MQVPTPQNISHNAPTPQSVQAAQNQVRTAYTRQYELLLYSESKQVKPNLVVFLLIDSDCCKFVKISSLSYTLYGIV